MSTAHIDLIAWLSFDKVFLDSIADEIADQEIAKLDTPIDTTDLIITACSEMYIDGLNDLIERIIKHNFKSVTIVVDWSVRKIYSQIWSDEIINKCKIIPISWYMVCTAIYLRKRNTIPLPSEWTWQNKKGLFLTGQLNRYNRIGLLKKLYDSNLLDNMIWTFPSPELQKDQVLKYFGDDVPNDFDGFFNFCSEHAIIDPVKRIVTGRTLCWTSWLLDGYKSTNFSIVSESLGDHVTEKTYVAMSFRHPFIIPNKPKLVKELKELGFKTFENYLPYKEYVDIEDNITRIDMVVENIRAFPKVIEDHKEEISIDIQHNYNLLQSLTAEAEEQLMNILPTLPDDIFDGLKPARELLGADTHEKYLEQEKILLEEENRKIFVKNYNVIRSDIWPDINDENDFRNLPEHIISECKEKFNFPLSIWNLD